MKSQPEVHERLGPLGRLRFLYVGSEKFDADLKYYHDSIGAELVWNVKAFGARVAALRLGDDPLLLLADHRPAPSCLPIFEVKDLQKTVSELKARGASPESGPFEIPNGPCCVFKDPSGNEFAIFQDVRPNAMEDEHPKQRDTGASRKRTISH